MLPDFVKVKAPVVQALNEQLQKIVGAHPRLSGIGHVHFFEGEDWSQGDEPGSPFREFSVPFTVENRDVIARGPAVFFEQVPAVAAAHADLLVRRAQEVFEEAAKAGNPNFGFMPSTQFSFEEYLQLIERMEIQFDVGGVAVMPTWEPANQEVEERIAAWLADPELQKRFDAVIDHKREAWRAREGNRKLAD